jgi:nucleotide-binding universal stress UspA family protein
VLTGGTVEAVMAWQNTLVPGGYGGAPTAMIGDFNCQEITEKALTEVISAVVDAADRTRVRSRVTQGHASQVLLDAADGADLLVVGSRGHGSFADALLGSVSQNCAHHARCPVLIMRGADET